nr:transposase (putative), gypsy type [Tanacetum cinerariifolium]
MPFADSYSAVAVATLNTRLTPIQKQPEALLCLVGLSQNYFLGDDVYLTFLYDDNRDMDLFNLISAPNPTKVKTRTRPRAAHEVSLLTATASRVIDMRDTVMALGSSGIPAAIEKSTLDFADEDLPLVIIERGDKTTVKVIPESGMGKEVATMGPVVNKRGRKRGNRGAKANAPPKVLRNDHVVSRPSQSTLEGKSLAAIGIEADSTGFVPVTQRTPVNAKSMSDPDSLSYAGPWLIPEQYITQIKAREKHIKNLEALLETEAGMKGAAEAKNVELVKELESICAQITGEEMIKVAFKEFKKYEDDRVNSQCMKIDARLDALSIDFDEVLYPHMLTAIASICRVVSDRIAKGMSEGLKHGVEHEKAKVDLATIEVYGPEANTKYVTALHALKDLKYPPVDQLEKLKDAPIDLIMASLFLLFLESDSREDAPQWICELRPSSSQLKILVYPEVRNPKDPWSLKEEILLEDAIAANISCAEKKKKCRMVCRTHGVGSTHHVRSNGVPLSVPTVVPQGLAILLVDAAIQTEITKDEASRRLLRSKSLPPIYNLDWP